MQGSGFRSDVAVTRPSLDMIRSYERRVGRTYANSPARVTFLAIPGFILLVRRKRSTLQGFDTCASGRRRPWCAPPLPSKLSHFPCQDHV